MDSAGPATGVPARLKARIAGAFYLLTIAADFFYSFAGNGFYVEGDASATAQHIAAATAFYRLDIAGNLVGALAYVVVTLLLYDLLKPVNRSISRLAVLFSTLGIALLTISFLCDSAPLYLLKTSAADAATLAMTVLDLSALSFTISLVFFGFYCVLVGWLLINAGYFPRFVGVLMGIAGACYVVDGFLKILAPGLEAHIAFIDYSGLVGEGALTLWLLFVGLDSAKWPGSGSTSKRLDTIATA